MLRSDARHNMTSISTDGALESITIDVVSEIERELLDSPYDMISMVFLLYDVPDTALQRLIVYQRVSKDAYSSSRNLLQEWTRVAKTKPVWKHELLEALLICQLYGIVKKMGFNVETLKRHYQPDDIFFNKYINPTKKALYKLCENMTSDNLDKLKRTLLTYRIDTTEYEACELVFLKLMSEKIVTPSEFEHGRRSMNQDFNCDKFIKLIQKLPGLETFANELNRLQSRGYDEPVEHPVASSSMTFPTPGMSTEMNQRETENNVMQDFSDAFGDLGMLNLKLDEGLQIESDSNKLRKDCYAIKDPQRIGLCLIINQENFYFCDQSIEDESLRVSLSNRKGSTFDKEKLADTMTSLKFEVISKDNLNHREMIEFIKRSVRENVRKNDSIFMLCIMSHGVRDHVFAADSVKVKVEDIQNILDSEDASKLRGIPKVLIIQACQVDNIPQRVLVADSGSSNYYLGKTDFLVFWATSPEYEAFRLEKVGSVFIQFLCLVIEKKGKSKHLYDIFTEVNNHVTKYCCRFNCRQVPLFKSTLRKSLYLQIPN